MVMATAAPLHERAPGEPAGKPAPVGRWPCHILTCACLIGYLFNMDMKLELVILPVSDVDRAKAFYVDQVGFNADFDQVVNEQIRFVQLTPPGSACSIAIGKGLTTKEPGSVSGLQMVVKDVQQLREELITRGVEASEIDVQAWGKFVTFSDPDGNGWVLQEIPPRQ
jgi:catechol 2,3-dioxygenase-like lactoylglutathione lyase family enzyme